MTSFFPADMLLHSWSLFEIIKVREHISLLRQLRVDLHTSGKGYSKISSHLNVPLSMVKAIPKKFKTTETTETVPALTVKRMVEKSPKLSVTELQQRPPKLHNHCHAV
ncbi:hypothetical protein CRENBAI_017992 [Crenichthys baileyi]|uniref:Sleeping Beauty transposase HTH domain-containing protein n=1 Tax=Crenichthys baileyi TaxID=28760 RepID=A0AAV9QQ90_9TELE